MRISLDGGKYTYVLENNDQYAERYGKPWRDLFGDKFILAMAHEIERALDVERLALAQVKETTRLLELYSAKYGPLHGA